MSSSPERLLLALAGLVVAAAASDRQRQQCGATESQ